LSARSAPPPSSILLILPPGPEERAAAEEIDAARAGPDSPQRPQPDRLFRAAFDSLAAHLAVLSGGGEILHVNRSWLAFATANGGNPDRTAVGTNYFDVCRGAAGAGSAQAPAAVTAIKMVLTGHKSFVEFDYPCHSPTEQRWFRFQATPLREASARVLVSHQDVSISRGLLTGREQEVLTHVASGLTSSEIAETLYLSRSTVETHIRNAIEKLDARTRSNAVVLAIGRGEIAPPSMIQSPKGDAAEGRRQLRD
jgi:DNA-binding CsgD family transcriptional regulator